MMAVSDPDAGKVLATPAIGAGSDGAAFDPGTGYAFSSNGDGTLTIVQQTGGKWDVLENIATERGARTIAVDEKTHKAYLPTAKTAPSHRRRARVVPAEHLQSAGRRQMTRRDWRGGRRRPPSRAFWRLRSWRRAHKSVRR